MANKVKQDGNNVWITNENDNQISEKYRFVAPYYVNVTKNFLEVLTVSKFMLDYNYTNLTNIFLEIESYLLTPLLVKKIIINLNTLEVLYQKTLEITFHDIINQTINSSVSRKLATNYHYFNPKNNILYDAQNKIVFQNVRSYQKGYWDQNLVVHKNYKYSYLHGENIIIENADAVIPIFDSKDLLIKNSIAYVYDIISKCIVEKIKLCDCEIKKSELSVFNLNDKFLIYEYIKDNSKITEVRNINNLSKVILKLSDGDFIITYDWLHSYPDKKTYSSLENCLHIYNPVLGHKLFLPEKESFLSEEYINKATILIDKENNKYIVAKYKNKIAVYSLPDFELILSGNYTNISLSKNADYFILENMDFKGIAALNGEIILKPSVLELYETLDTFYYYNKPLEAVKK